MNFIFRNMTTSLFGLCSFSTLMTLYYLLSKADLIFSRPDLSSEVYQWLQNRNIGKMKKSKLVLLNITQGKILEDR